jgi:tetratricopeptide (TPR) repeat protein
VNAGAHLQLFLLDNWTGPPVKESDDPVVPQDEKKALNDLSCDGEVAYHLTSSPHLLLSARSILVDRCDVVKLCPSAGWWTLRCLISHQCVLDNTSATLYNAVVQVVQLVVAEESELRQFIRHSKALQCQFHLEVGHAYLLYGQVSQAEEHFQIAKSLCGLSIALTGALGKRTRYQEVDISQLIVEVDRQDGTQPLGLSWEKSESTVCVDAPKNVALEDDTVLDKIKFADTSVILSINSLTALEQAVLLSECRLKWKSNPTHKLTTEELIVYLSRVLDRTVCWSVHCCALMYRSLLEKTMSRKVERAMNQTQVIVDHLLQDRPGVSDRLLLIHATSLPPKWIIQQQLAELLESLGCLDSALEIYKRLEMWENIIMCYQQQKRSGQAEKVIRERLAVCETPILLCYLGDATLDPLYYEQAWELSNYRNARSQRSLGLYYLRKEMYKECIPCFQRTLALNGLQIGVWFSLGCASLRTDNLELAITAFRRCVLLDSENFEGWNNLAASLIKRGEKRKACSALKEALRCDYENWKVWENYLFVCTDLGEWEETVRAYHRLMDLRDKYVDAQVLALLVQYVASETQESRQTGGGMYRKTAELFGRLTSKTTSNPTLWQLYSQLHKDHYDRVDGSTETLDKALRSIQKAVNSALHTASTDRDITTLNESLKMGAVLGRTCRQVFKLQNGTERHHFVKTLSSVKLSLQNLLSKTKRFENESVLPHMHDIRQSITSLESELGAVVDCIGSLKQS